MSLFVKLKPGDRITLDNEVVMVCARNRGGELRLEISAPHSVSIRHSRGPENVANEPAALPQHNI